MPKQNLFAIVNKRGSLVTVSGQLPIYWYKNVAQSVVKAYSEFDWKVVPIPADSLHKLILSHTKKAK